MEAELALYKHLRTAIHDALVIDTVRLCQLLPQYLLAFASSAKLGRPAASWARAWRLAILFFTFKHDLVISLSLRSGVHFKQSA